MELLRKTAQGYARHLQPNEAVQLGEDLLLRAHVITGDGKLYEFQIHSQILNDFILQVGIILN